MEGGAGEVVVCAVDAQVAETVDHDVRPSAPPAVATAGLGADGFSIPEVTGVAAHVVCPAGGGLLAYPGGDDVDEAVEEGATGVVGLGGHVS